MVSSGVYIGRVFIYFGTAMKPQFVFVRPELTQFIVDEVYATSEKKAAALKEYYWPMGLQEFISSY